MRPRHEPTPENRKLVEGLAAFGTPVSDICLSVGVSYRTLRRYYGEQLYKASIRANANVAGALYKSAIRGNVTAQIFWLKTRAGWRTEDSVKTVEQPLGKKQIAQQEAKSALTSSAEWGDDLIPEDWKN